MIFICIVIFWRWDGLVLELHLTKPYYEVERF